MAAKKGEDLDKPPPSFVSVNVRVLFCFLHDGFESLWVVHCKVGKNLAVNLDSGLVETAHELRVGKSLKTGCGIDALYPESAEIAFLRAAVAVGVGQAFFPSVLGDSPDILAGTKVTAGELEDSLALCS